MTDKAEIEATQQEADIAADASELEAQDAGVNAAADLQSQDAEGDADDGNDDLVVSIGEEAPPEQDATDKEIPRWVKRLRRDAYRTLKENQKLKREIEEIRKSVAPPPSLELGKEPEPEDFDYDMAAFKTAHRAWLEKERQVKSAQEEKRKAEEAQVQRAQQRMAAYEEAKRAMPALGMEEAEAKVSELLSPVQQQIVIHGAKNPALLIFALGKYPQKAKELAAIDDLAEFAFAAARLEVEVKTGNRKPSVSPEKPVTGTAAVGIGGSDATLERLRAEADKTGDRTPVVRYLAQQRKLKG